MANASEDLFALDELEHQALDLLESLPLASLWTSSGNNQDKVPEPFAAAVAETGEDLEEVEAAIATAQQLFQRLVGVMAEHLLGAAESLAATDDRGALEPEAIARTKAALNESPELGFVLASAVESVGVSLGLDREALAWAVLIELAERADRRAASDVQACSQAIAERLEAAQSGPEQAEPTRALRVFRSAAVVAAGPEVRARLLAANHPEHLALARALVSIHSDPASLVEQFDAARAALAEAETSKPSTDSPEAMTDGPKRKFTVVHLVLALIVLGLTVWHYWLR